MKIRHIFLIGVVSLVAGSLSAPVTATSAKSETFFVAVNGSDSWSGRLPEPNPNRTDGPFATVGAACVAARNQGAEQPRKVIVQAGRYFLDKPLELNAGDAGLTIESAPGADVCLYGGRKVTGWKKDGADRKSVV